MLRFRIYDLEKQLSDSSSDEEKAAVDAARNVTGTASGSAMITVDSGEGEKTFRVYVTTPEISMTQITKIAGNVVQLNILGTNGETEWYTDNPAVALVDENELVTALSTGSGQSTTIHAKVDGTELMCQISVEPIPRLESTYKLFAFSEGTAVRQYNSFISKSSVSGLYFRQKRLLFGKNQDMKVPAEKEYFIIWEETWWKVQFTIASIYLF